MNHVSVSILIPCFNAERFIGETVASVLSQTAPGVETIVVDDGSTDQSLQILRAFESRGIKLISQENRGQCSALNAAFAAAGGDYIQYLDADDILHPRKIELQLSRLIQAGSLAMAACTW